MDIKRKSHHLIMHLHRWISKHHKATWIIVCIFVVFLGGITTFIILSHKPTTVAAPKTTSNTTKKPTPAPTKYYSPLTGNLVSNESATKQPVTAIMIENSPEARPQSGLKNSGVVFEAIAEGGITRFLVIYQQEKPQMIGPVRSIRLYDVEWIAPFNASISHVGGSLYGLAEIRNGNYRDIDQFFNPNSYWRSNDRYAPHNVYTSFAKLDELNKSKGYKTSTFTGFARTNEKASDKPTATNIDITLSSFLYNLSYVYNTKTNSYVRYQGGAPHLDRESGQITPKVVIAMYVDETTVLEDGYREKITTIGSGKAVIFQNGLAINATWHKPSKQEQITFTDKSGKKISLIRGQTWITAVPNNKGSISWE